MTAKLPAGGKRLASWPRCLRRAALTEQHSWRAQVEIPVRVSPRPALRRQGCSQRLGDKWRHQQRLPHPGRRLPQLAEISQLVRIRCPPPHLDGEPGTIADGRNDEDRIGTLACRCLDLLLLHVQAGLSQPAHHLHKHKSNISTVLMSLQDLQRCYGAAGLSSVSPKLIDQLMEFLSQ